MEKNVINLVLYQSFFLLSFLLSNNSYCQINKELDSEQHNIVAKTFEKSKEESIWVYYHTIKYESWMNLLWDKDQSSKNGIGFCSFDSPGFHEAFDSLRTLVVNIQEKTFNEKKLEKKFKLVKSLNKKNVLYFSESIIINNYSFQFVRSNTSKSVHVQKKDQNGNWNYECGVPIYFVLR
jgi:hypothetical protein